MFVLRLLFSLSVGNMWQSQIIISPENIMFYRNRVFRFSSAMEDKAWP